MDDVILVNDGSTSRVRISSLRALTREDAKREIMQRYDHDEQRMAKWDKTKEYAPWPFYQYYNYYSIALDGKSSPVNITRDLLIELDLPVNAASWRKQHGVSIDQ